MKKIALKLAFLLSAALLVSTNIASQIEVSTTETASSRLEVITRQFYVAVDKPSVRLLKEVITEYELLIAFAKEHGDHRTEAEAISRIGEAKALIGQMPVALDRLRTASEIWESLGEPQKAANVLTTIGNVQYVIEDYRNARDTLERASALRAGGDPVGESNNLIAFAGVYKALGEPEKSVSAYEAALILSRTAKDKYAEGFILEKMAFTRKADRLELLNRAVDAYRASEGTSVTNASIVNRILTATGNWIDRLTRAEAARFKNFKTEQERQEFLATSRSAGVIPLDFDEGDRGRGSHTLGKIGIEYFAIRDRTKAVAVYLKALEWARQNRSEMGEFRILGYLAGFYASPPKDEEHFTFYFTLMQMHSLYRAARQVFDTKAWDELRPALRSAISKFK